MSEFRWVNVSNKDELEVFYKSILGKIKEAARECGYAIGIHGSLRRDLDLIATPWVEEHTDIETLVRKIHLAACGLESESYQWEKKPLGRMATCFPICWVDFDRKFEVEKSTGHIDLSIVGVK